MKKIITAFTGPSNSGKTTLIQKVATELIKNGFKVCIVKHDPKDKAVFDKEGKDSWKFAQTGADVAVVSPNRTTYFKQANSDIEEIIRVFDQFDYLLVEGLKTLDLPRIAIFREKLDVDYFDISDAIATDETIDSTLIPKDSEHLDLNNELQIIQWIDKNGKRL